MIIVIITVSLLHKAEKPSVCISGTLITEQCLHQLKWDLHDVKAVPLMVTEFIFTSLKTHCSSVHRYECVKDKAINHCQWFESYSTRFFTLVKHFSLHTTMAQTVNAWSILPNRLKRDFWLKLKPQHCLILLHLTWLNTTNSVLYVLLESINLMMLKLTRQA